MGMENKEETLKPIEEEVLEQVSGGVSFVRPQYCICMRCGWLDLLPPKNWICPGCGGNVTAG